MIHSTYEGGEQFGYSDNSEIFIKGKLITFIQYLTEWILTTTKVTFL